MFKLLLLFFIFPFSIAFHNFGEYYDELFENCTKLVIKLGNATDQAEIGDKIDQKFALENKGTCYELQKCGRQDFFRDGKIYNPKIGKKLDTGDFFQSLCTVLDSLSGPLGECFDKIRTTTDKNQLMANVWDSLGPNQKRNFKKDRDGNITESCISIMNPYSQSLIDKDCTPEAVEEFGKVSKTLKHIGCMVMGFFLIDDFYNYIDNLKL